MAANAIINRHSDKFLLDSYSGRGGYLYNARYGIDSLVSPANAGVNPNYLNASYLVRHPRESDVKYTSRMNLAVYPNFVKKIVNVFIGFLWKQEPLRSDYDELYSSFLRNANGAGKSLNFLLTSYQRLALILGTVYIIVDKSDKTPTSKADETMPYLGLRLPAQLVDQVVDDTGEWVRVTFSEKDKNGIDQYRTYTAQGWTVSKDLEGKEITASGEYSLGCIPVVRLHADVPLLPTDTRALSWSFDLANLNWSLFNLLSELRELLRGQTFSILALPVKDDTEREKLKDLTISTENAITYNPDGGGQPMFIAPPDGPVQQYMAQIAATINDIYRVANLEFIGGVQQSGVALAFHFQEANSTLSTMADLCEQAERDIARLVYAWQGQEFKGHISYPREFNLSDLTQTLTQALDAVTLDISPEFNKALKKLVARQMLGGDVAPAIMQTIDDEIDASGDPYGDRVAKEAIS